jgi:DNA repair protein RadD
VPPRGEYERCGYRWTFKECAQCQAPNDIAARYCCECKSEIVDPNEKLRGEFKALKRDPTRTQTDAITSMAGTEGVSQKGNKTLRLDIVTPYRQFSVWLQPEAAHSKGMRDWAKYLAATHEDATPRSVTYRKNPETSFYEVLDWNREPDYAPE